MRGFGEALRFLTIIPLPGRPPTRPWATLAAYPWAGLVIGILAALVSWLGSLIFGPAITAFTAVAAKIILTGGLHYDGLADVADGLGGGRDRERRLAIMSDSRLGSFGGLALLLMFGFQLALSYEVLSLPDPGSWRRWAPFILAPVLSRGVIVTVIPAFRSARPGGMGDYSRRIAGPAAPILAGISALFLAIILFGPSGAVVAALTAALMFPVAAGLSRPLGGLTGDTYGALIETGDAIAMSGAILALQFDLPTVLSL